MKQPRPRLISAVATMLVVLAGYHPGDALAQTREQGPWWPNAEWGPDDQAGASNRITPEKILSSLRLVATGKVYELGQVYEMGMPLYGNRTYNILIPEKGGILNQENMRFDDLVADGIYEFLFIMTPIRFKGATGSPGRPIAIR